MKRLLIVVLAIAMVLSLTLVGCDTEQNGNVESENQTEKQTEKQTEVRTEKPVEVQSETQIENQVDTQPETQTEGSGSIVETDTEETGSEETDADETDADETNAKETNADETNAKETEAEETNADETDADETDANETDAYETEPESEVHVCSFGEWTTVKGATCTEEGLKERVCECGEKETQVISALGHTEVIDAAAAPTCTETGLTEGKHCEVCEAVLVEQEIIAVKHDYATKLVYPTSSEQGYTNYTCVDCGYSYKDDYISFSEGFLYEVVDSYCKIIDIGTCTDSCIVFPTEIDGYVVKEIGKQVFLDCEERITKIIIPDTIEKIDSEAFAYCSNLKSVIMGKGLTYVGDNAFAGCSNLEAVYIEDVAKWCSISFGGYFGQWGRGGNPLTYANSLYLNGRLVKELVIPDGVTEIGQGAFYGCSGLEKVTIPESVTRIGSEAFDGCNNVIEDQDGVQYIERWVVGYSDIAKSITLRPDTIGIADYAFWDCEKRFSIVIPDSVISIGEDAFSGCENMTDVTIGNGVTSIGAYAFRDCKNLKKVSMGNSVTHIGDLAFSACWNLADITLPNSLKIIGRCAFMHCDSFTNVTIPDGVTNIGDEAFWACSNLTTVTIPKSVQRIGEQVFQFCDNFTAVNYTGSHEDWEKIDIASANYGWSINYNYVPE